MIGKIVLNDIRFYAFHGVSSQETKVGNYFIINLIIEASFDDAVANDKLECTINYAEVYEYVKKEMEIPSKLLEHAAGRILNTLKKKFPQIKGIEISLSKQNPPLGGDIKSASIILKETYN